MPWGSSPFSCRRRVSSPASLTYTELAGKTTLIVSSLYGIQICSWMLFVNLQMHNLRWLGAGSCSKGSISFHGGLFLVDSEPFGSQSWLMRRRQGGLVPIRNRSTEPGNDMRCMFASRWGTWDLHYNEAAIGLAVFVLE